MKLYRQGDLLFMERPHLPQKKETRVASDTGVILKGQHTHQLIGGAVLDVWADNSFRWLHVPSGGKVAHEEHATITLPPGVYEVRRQREYVGPGEERDIYD